MSISVIPPLTPVLILIKLYKPSGQYFIKFSNVDRKILVNSFHRLTIIDSLSHHLLSRFHSTEPATSKLGVI